MIDGQIETAELSIKNIPWLQTSRWRTAELRAAIGSWA